MDVNCFRKLFKSLFFNKNKEVEMSILNTHVDTKWEAEAKEEKRLKKEADEIRFFLSFQYK